MKVKQLSVFLENKAGRINQLTKILADANINMRAFSLAESPEFGIMRIVVSGDSEAAAAIIKQNDFMVKVTDVICMVCNDAPGAMSVIMEQLAAQGVFIEYMYAFADGDKANIIIRPTDVERCDAILSNHK